MGKILSKSPESSMWAYLIHLSYNMWGDREVPELDLRYWQARPYLRCEQPLWDEIIRHLADSGFNTVVIDLGDAIKYSSHPEIAVRKAWSISRLQKELAKIRKLGMEPIPKLNFSTCHDAWLGPYSRCVSTPRYYAVCKELVAEVIDLFDRPRLFHIGMDEEDAANHRYHEYVVLRQYDLWWHDLYFLVDQVEKANTRAWVWSDYVWQHPEVFLKKMPRSVLQSNWYYGKSFSPKLVPVKAYLDLEEHGYDQVPTSSNWSCVENTAGTVRFCRKHVAPRRLKGFLQTVWRPTLAEVRDRHIDAIDLMAEAMCP